MPPGQEEQAVPPSAPASQLPPRTARKWHHGGRSPGARLPSPRCARSVQLTTQCPPLHSSVTQLCARAHTHTHTFFLYIRSHYGLSQEMGHSSPCATAGLCRLSTLNEVVASTNPKLPVLPPPVPPAATSLTSLSVGLFLSCG